MNGQIHLGEVRPINYFMTIAVVLGLMFFFIAPDSDTQVSWLSQLLQWQIQTVAPMLLAIFVHWLLAKYAGSLNISNPWLRLIISGLVACMLVSPIALASDVLLGGEPLNRPIFAQLLDEFLALAPPVLICWVAINGPFVLGWRTHRAKANDKTVTDSQVQTETEDHKTQGDCLIGFEKLIPMEMRGELIYLKSELHYLQVVTVNGRSLILYSLKAAMSELEGRDGLQPHRSYWVNTNYIESLLKNGREGTLALSNGETIPVSRSKMSNLKERIKAVA